MTENQNATTEDIDRLRAGLLDHQPDLKARVQSALKRDQNLRAQDGLWRQLRDQLDASGENARQLSNQLRLRRRRALTGQGVKKPQRFSLPQAALAATASLALTLSAVLWFSGGRQNVFDSAGNSIAATIAATGAEQPLPVASREFDLKNNVDFYVWMEDQDDLFIDVPHKGT